MINRFCVMTMLLAANAAIACADCWQPDPAQSNVMFVASQAGAPFEGAFRTFSGRICLDAVHAEAGSIEITIDTAAVDTGLPEFDEALRGADFFNSSRWPIGHFVSSNIRALGAGKYSVRGSFTLRDITREIEVPFSMTAAGTGMQISGEITIKRLDYDIGLGEWRDTHWVGDDVLLRFTVALKANADQTKMGSEQSLRPLDTPADSGD